MNRFPPWAALVLSVWFAGRAPVAPAGAESVPTFPLAAAQQEDVIFFRNGDVLRGRVLNEVLRVHTPYALVEVPLPACEVMTFAGLAGGRDTLYTVNANRVSGDVVDRAVRFRSALASAPWEIRRERIRRIDFHPRPPDTEPVPPVPPQKSDLFLMANGDRLTGRPAAEVVRVQVGGSVREVPFPEVRSLDIRQGNGTGVEVFTQSEERIRGVLVPDAISLHLDIGSGIEPFFLDQCTAVYRDDGVRRAAVLALQDRAALEEGAAGEAGRDPARPGVLTNSVGMRLKRIEPGAFVMGSGRGNSDEAPPHRVVLDHPYYIGMHEVTQQQWGAVMGSNPSCFADPLRPVERVSWDDARLFCRRLSELESRTYRLPSEAEWEYACRAGTITEFPWGEDFREAFAWVSENAGGRTREAGTREPNAWGLHDMIGNVWEWVEDAYGPYPGGSLPESAWLSGAERVLRGGGWTSVSERCRAASRTFQNPGYGSSSTSGFRVVAEP